MELKRTIQVALAVYFVGLVGFYFKTSFESFLWFALGGGLALVNTFFAAWAVRLGVGSLKRTGTFMGLLMFKSLSFLAVVAVILMFLKPILLPFTAGLGVVILSAVVVAIWESRRYFRQRG